MSSPVRGGRPSSQGGLGRMRTSEEHRPCRGQPASPRLGRMTGPRTPEDLAAWRQAKGLIDQIGDGALESGAYAAHDFAKASKEADARFWDKVRQAVEHLLAQPELARLIDPPAVSDADVWRAAKQMIDRHGESAALEATTRADKLLD